MSDTSFAWLKLAVDPCCPSDWLRWWPQVGWKHQEAVKDLEEVRKVRSHDYYVAKRKLKALKTKATATVEGQA